MLVKYVLFNITAKQKNERHFRDVETANLYFPKAQNGSGILPFATFNPFNAFHTLMYIYVMRIPHNYGARYVNLYCTNGH